MFFSVLDIVMLVLAVLSLLIWLFFYFKGKSQQAFFEPLDDKIFPVKDLYFVGYAVTEFFHFQYKTKADRQLRKQLEVLYEAKYADYYIRVIYAQKITMAMTIGVLAFALYGLGDDLVMFGVGLMFAGLAYYYFGTAVGKRITKRSEQMLSDFSEVVSKLALLTNAGMILREAWEQIAFTGETELYQEMQRTVGEMNNGVAEVDAIYNFGSRCIIPEIKKLASTIIQGIVKGNAELGAMLTQQSKEIWNEKKQNVRRQGEKAASKLLIPICVMFGGILIMILVPIFTNLGA